MGIFDDLKKKEYKKDDNDEKTKIEKETEDQVNKKIEERKVIFLEILDFFEEHNISIGNGITEEEIVKLYLDEYKDKELNFIKFIVPDSKGPHTHWSRGQDDYIKNLLKYDLPIDKGAESINRSLLGIISRIYISKWEVHNKNKEIIHHYLSKGGIRGWKSSSILKVLKNNIQDDVIIGHSSDGHNIHSMLYNKIAKEFLVNSNQLSGKHIKEIIRKHYTESYQLEKALEPKYIDKHYREYITWMAGKGEKSEQPPSIRRIQKGTRNRDTIYEWIK